MLQIQKKEMVCQAHASLLYLILQYGNGAMLLPQLRALAVGMGIYTNGQAVNRAVRELKGADILTRQTWIDNNSDLILARKYALRYFSGKTSQEVATPQRPRTMSPYILQARKIDWLLDIIRREHLTDRKSVETYIRNWACDLFLRLPELPEYYQRYSTMFAQANPVNYRTQLARLTSSDATAYPVTTLEQMHRRGIYITQIIPTKNSLFLHHSRGGICGLTG